VHWTLIAVSSLGEGQLNSDADAIIIIIIKNL